VDLGGGIDLTISIVSYYYITTMKKKSTSIHQINADSRMSRVEKVLYMVLNRVNNTFPYLNADKKIVYRDFKCEDLKEQWENVPPQSTPARKLCDLFFIKLPWKHIQTELGEMHVLDCGCGSGRYGERLLQYSPIPLTTYTGIDVKESERWQTLEQQHPNFTFHPLNNHNISPYIPEKTNFILSVTALEHFAEDIFFFEQIKDFIDSREKNVLQIHFFPSRVCLKLFRFHGIRQYTPRTVGKFSRMFHPSSYMTLFNLGGKMCSRLHSRYITRPLVNKKHADLRKSHPDIYDKKLYDAVRQDMAVPSSDPTFYALVIHSYFRNKLF
jgi:SAM-dependent methyltransferase